MMSNIDTLKLALEALESTAHGQDLYELEERAITAIKQALNTATPLEAQPAPVHHLVPDPVATLYPELYRANWEAMHGKEATPPAAQPAPVQPVAHCGQGPNFCKQCANQQAEWCAAILYRDHNEKPWVHVIQKDLPSGTKLVAYGITKGQL